MSYLYFMLKTAFLLIIFFVQGCSNYPRFHLEPAASNDWTVSTGDTLIRSVPEVPSVLDPLKKASPLQMEIYSMIYSGLVRIDENYTVQPDLAESWSWNKDRTILTFKLRKGVFWNNGLPLTAEDVVYTFNKMKSSGFSLYPFRDYSFIENLFSEDTHSLTVILKQIFSPAEYFFDFPVFCSSNNLQKISENSEIPYGTGYFKVLTYIPGEELVLCASRDSHLGRPFLDRFVFRSHNNDSSGLIHLDNHFTDAYSLNIDQYKRLGWSIPFYDKFRIIWTLENEQGLIFNCRNPLFTVKFRNALCTALNRLEIKDNIFYGLARLKGSPFTSGHWASLEMPFPEYFSAEEADKILDLENLTDADHSGLRDFSGKDIVLQFIMSDSVFYGNALADKISEYWIKIGISTEITVMNSSDFLHALTNGCFDAALYESSLLAEDPDVFFNACNSSSVDSYFADRFRFSGYKNQEIAVMAELSRKAESFAERKKLFNQISVLMMEEKPVFPLHNLLNPTAFEQRFHGIWLSESLRLTSVKTWWVPADIQKR